MTVAQDGSLTARFTAIKYPVTVSAKKADGSATNGVKVTFNSQDKTTDSSGEAEFSSPAGTYSLGVQGPVSGGPGIQYVFVQWNDGSVENPRSIAVNAAATYDAVYKTEYQLTTQVDPSGSGTTSPAVGTYWYDSGQTVSIQVSPASGYTFRSWAGSGSGSYSGPASSASVTMNSPASEKATLAKPTEAAISAVTVIPNPAVQGSAMIFTVDIVNVGTRMLSSLSVQLSIYGPDGSLVGSGSGSIGTLRARA